MRHDGWGDAKVTMDAAQAEQLQAEQAQAQIEASYRRVEQDMKESQRILDKLDKEVKSTQASCRVGKQDIAAA